MIKLFSGSIMAAAIFAAAAAGNVYAQEDLARTDDLPSRIGGANCNNIPQRNGVGTVSGFLNVRGSVNPGHTPVFTVAIYAGGSFVARNKVKNGGAFIFYCVPRDNVTLRAEVDSTEVGSVSLGQISVAPYINRQDLDVQWTEPTQQPQKSGVVAAQNLYKRSDENQRLFDKALDKLAEADGGTSISLLNQIVKSDPADFASWAFLGNIYFNLGRFDEAENKFTNSLNANKGYVPAMLGAGRSALNQKKLARAIEVLTAAYAVEPGSADINHYLGEAYLQDRKGSLAIVYMNKAIDIAPMQKAELHLRLGALYNAAGAKDLAAKQFAMYLQKRPDDPARAKLEQYISENSK